MFILNRSQIVIPEQEYYDSTKNEFIPMPSTTIPPLHIQLEHSLISISKWESRWHVSFFDNNESLTGEQLSDYIRCMVIGNQKEDIVPLLTEDDVRKIVNYIGDEYSARVMSKKRQKRRETRMTSETIYYLMIQYGIPFECEKWNFNRLMALIDICGEKGSSGVPAQKRSEKDLMAHYLALNNQRRAKYKSKG